MRQTLIALAFLGLISQCACSIPTVHVPRMETLQGTPARPNVSLSATLEPWAQDGVSASSLPLYDYLYTVTIRTGRIRLPHLILSFSGLSTWMLVTNTVADPPEMRNPPGEPQGDCAYEDAPVLLARTRNTAAWDWTGRGLVKLAWVPPARPLRCQAAIIITPRQLSWQAPDHIPSVVVYRDLTSGGTIDPGSELGRISPST